MRSLSLLFLTLLIATGSLMQSASPTVPQRRAVLIGIDHYHALEPRARTAADLGRTVWQDLDGCVNDILAVKEVLKARYGFHERDLRVLTNAEATREAILGAFQTHLADASSPGDIAFIYYSGHGSQKYNSKSIELDRKDETLVPADSIRGAADIRDKELKRAFNAIQAKGAVLTAVFDCCHSGSISRGLPAEGKSRRVEPDRRDANDADDGTPGPASQGALVLSAAQDFEEAKEALDEQGRAHGAFTMAFLEVMRASSTELSAQDLFTRIRGALKADGKAQEPVLEADGGRLAKPLLGLGSARLEEPVVVIGVEAGRVALQGGLAHGLNPGCLLRRQDDKDGPPVRLRLQDGATLTRSWAKVEAGKASDIRLGDVFTLDRFMPPASAFRVYLPPPQDSAATERFLGVLRALPGTDASTWVQDPTTTPLTHTLTWNGKAWLLGNTSTGTIRDLGARPTARNLRALGTGKAVRCLVAWPTPAPTYQHLLDCLKRDPFLGGVRRVQRPGEAHYALVTRLEGPDASHRSSAWVRPGASSRFPQDSRSPLPVLTDWAGASEAAQLAKKLSTLVRIHGWVTLASPPVEAFPYVLALKNLATGELREGEGRSAKGSLPNGANAKEPPLIIGERYRMVLRRKPSSSPLGGARYIYIFILDQQGRSQLLFPREAGMGNRLPVAGAWPELLELDRDPEIGAPEGTDTYFMLTSEEPLPDAGTVLNWDPVLGEASSVAGPSRGASLSPLGRLLAGGTALRGAAHEPPPMGWSLRRTEFRTVQK